MATQRGTNNLASQPGTAPVPISSGDGGGKMASFYDDFVVPAGAAQNDIVIMGPSKALKKGDRFISFSLDFDAMGAGVTLQIGDDGSAGRYSAAIAANAAGQNSTRVNGILGYVLTQDRELQVTIGGGAPTAATKFRLHWNVLRA